MRKKLNFRHFDRVLFATPILIFLIGIASIYSASFREGQAFDQSLVTKQLLWMGIGALAVFLIIRVDYFRLHEYAWPVYGASLFLLVIVLFMPSRMGAHRWIGIGGFNFQPSEFAKFAVILFLARFLADNKYEFTSKFKLWVPLAAMAVPFFLVLKEPDLGTALTLVPILLSMLYLWGVRAKLLLAALAAGLAVSPVLFHFLKDYQKSRILVFIDPNLDPLGAGYTIIQSKIAIGSGGFWGKGFMSGTQTQLRFVPERHTDFIFSVIAEEGGFLASAAVLTLFWIIVKKGYIISSQTPDRFGSQLACGIATLVGVQAVVNLGMTMGLLPVVGMPLPLVSYGGSSVVMTMFSIALLINIKMRRPLG